MLRPDPILVWLHDWLTYWKVEKGFRRKKDPWGYQNSPYEQGRHAALLEILNGKKYNQVLEVGCAEGVFTKRLAPLAGELLAVDISPTALERAKQYCHGYAHIRFMEANVRGWQAPHVFDLVVLADILCYIFKNQERRYFYLTKDGRNLLEKIAGWVRPQGYLLISNGYAAEQEKSVREGWRDFFKEQGFCLRKEMDFSMNEKEKEGCLVSLLENCSY